MPTPIDSLEAQYTTHVEHLRAVEDALMKQFNLGEQHRLQIKKAVAIAFAVGRSTTTTDDWCDT
jgi:hypothetical protein